jgi:alkylation response protein AidB-like acyl-CoA dehydrogenase
MAMTRQEAAEFARSVRAACASLSTKRAEDITFGAADSGFDHQLWLLLCQQLGAAEIVVPTSGERDATDTVALGVVAHELGRALAPVPFLASAVLATGLVAELGCEKEALDVWISGARTAAAIFSSFGGPWDPTAVSISAAGSAGDWTLTGVARHVLHGRDADDYVIVADAGTALTAFLVDRHDAGVTVEPEQVLDGTRPMATVSLAQVRGRRLGGQDSVDEIVARHVDRALAVLAAEQVGTCERLLELTTEYAKTRSQFGRPIGSFQSIKHALANNLVDLEWATSASQAALERIGPREGADRSWRASLAKAVCSEALRQIAHTGVQVHGGLGFSWEGPVHRYLRRARTDEVIFGGPSYYWSRLALEAAREGQAPELLAGRS